MKRTDGCDARGRAPKYPGVHALEVGDVWLFDDIEYSPEAVRQAARQYGIRHGRKFSTRRDPAGGSRAYFCRRIA